MNKYTARYTKNPQELEPDLGLHIGAMTYEDLHSKVDIAMELAHRDKEIQYHCDTVLILATTLAEVKACLDNWGEDMEGIDEESNTITIKADKNRLHYLVDWCMEQLKDRE